MPILMKNPDPFMYNEVVPAGNFQTNLYFMGKIVKDMKAGFSPIVAICGRQRMGKSFVGMMLLNKILPAFNKELIMDRCCYYEPYGLITALGGKNNDAFMLDEIGDSMGRREWYKQTHRAFEKIILTQGYKSNLFVFISPHISDIDKIFVKHLDYLIKVERRGHFKVWKMIKRYDQPATKDSFKKYFLDDVFYKKGDIPKKLWAAYERYSFDQKELIRLKYEDSEEVRVQEDKKLSFAGLTDKWGGVE